LVKKDELNKSFDSFIEIIDDGESNSNNNYGELIETVEKTILRKK